jgi:hypothetical protein
MHHKQQLTSPTNHGPKSVGHASTETSTPANRADTQDPCGSAHRQLRCEAMRSLGPDSTGEGAVCCGACADVVCEFCGPLCLHCAEETFCFYREHKLAAVEALPGDGSGETVAPKPLFKVVYLQLLCANCGDVRLALPLAANPRSGTEQACPECAAPALLRYLAHGLTRRELPFYERFSLREEEEEDIEDKAAKPRLPWDRRSPHWEE